MVDERLDTLLHGDRVDDRLALDALEPGLDDIPLRRVDHQRHARDVGLGRDQLDEAVHGRDAVDHAFVHVDVDDLCARLDLLSCDVERGAVVLRLDQLAEPRRPGDVGALTDVDEQRLLGHRQGLEPGQPQGGGDLARHPGLLRRGGLRDRCDVVWRRAAAATEQVHQTGLGELTHDRRHVLGRLVVLAERVGQSRVGVARDEGVGDASQLRGIRTHLGSAEGAVEPDRQRAGVAHGVPERLGDLPREGASGGVGDGAGDDDRPAAAVLLEQCLEGEDRGLGVEGVEDRLDDQEVGTAVDQATRLVDVGPDQLVEGDVALARVVHVGRDRGGAVRRPERAEDPPRLVRRPGGHLVACRAREACGRQVHLVGERLHAVVGEGDPLGVEGVGLDEVRTGFEVCRVDTADDVRLGQAQQVVVALEVALPVGEPIAAVVVLAESLALDHRAHRAVHHEDALGQRGPQLVGGVGLQGGGVRHRPSMAQRRNRRGGRSRRVSP